MKKNPENTNHEVEPEPVFRIVPAVLITFVFSGFFGLRRFHNSLRASPWAGSVKGLSLDGCLRGGKLMNEERRNPALLFRLAPDGLGDLS